MIMSTDGAPMNLADFLENISAVDDKSFADDNERHQAYLAVRKLANRLETPYETLLRRTFDEVL